MRGETAGTGLLEAEEEVASERGKAAPARPHWPRGRGRPARRVPESRVRLAGPPPRARVALCSGGASGPSWYSCELSLRLRDGRGLGTHCMKYTWPQPLPAVCRFMRPAVSAPWRGTSVRRAPATHLQPPARRPLPPPLKGPGCCSPRPGLVTARSQGHEHLSAVSAERVSGPAGLGCPWLPGPAGPDLAGTAHAHLGLPGPVFTPAPSAQSPAPRQDQRRTAA